MSRIGILGGTFDPPHIGHFVLADCAIETLNLDRLLFVPAGNPPHKLNETRLTIEHRLAMLTLALEQDTRFTLSRVDVDRPGPHYAADMVEILQRENPDAELFFVMGADSFRDLPHWHYPHELVERVKLAVMRRATYDIQPDMHDTLFTGLKEKVVMIDAPLIEVSSTEIVERLKTNKSVRYLVPPPVLQYIASHRVYRD